MSIETTKTEARQGTTIKNMPLVLGISTATAAIALLAIFGMAIL